MDIVVQLNIGDLNLLYTKRSYNYRCHTHFVIAGNIYSHRCKGVVRSISITTAYTTFLILITNSVQYPKYLGAVNGSSQTIQMFLMAAAPAVGSSLYAWSITGDHSFPFDYRLYWVLFGLLCLLMLGMSAFLSRTLDKRKMLVEGLDIIDGKKVEGGETESS